MIKDPKKTQRTITHENDITTVEFITYLREDFVNTILRIRIRDSRLFSIFFHSNTFGVAEWENGKGFVNCNKWENEDQAKSQSNLSYHYTSLILNGSQNNSYAVTSIVPDVCKSFNGELAADIAKKASSTISLDDHIDLNTLYHSGEKDR